MMTNELEFSDEYFLSKNYSYTVVLIIHQRHIFLNALTWNYFECHIVQTVSSSHTTLLN